MNIEDLIELFKRGNTPTEEHFRMLIENSYNAEPVEVEEPKKVLKILTIGGQITSGGLRYLLNICDSVNIEIEIYHIYKNGTPFSDWLRILNSNSPELHFSKPFLENGVINANITDNITPLSIINSENWDIVLYQQDYVYERNLEYFNPYLQQVIDFINANTNNEKIIHVLTLNWFLSRFADTDERHKEYISTFKEVFKTNTIDFLHPVCTAIQNANTNLDLKDLDGGLAKNNNNLIFVGRYIESLTFFETFIGPLYNKSIMHDVNFTITDKYLTYLCKLAAYHASKNPFAVTKI